MQGGKFTHRKMSPTPPSAKIIFHEDIAREQAEIVVEF